MTEDAEQSSREPSDLQLMTWQADVLYTYNHEGRMQQINDRRRSRAPRLFLGRTRQGTILRVRDDVSQALVAHIESLLAREPDPVDLRQEPAMLPVLRSLLTVGTAQPDEESGPAYLLPAEHRAAGGVVEITPARERLMLRFFGDRLPILDSGPPCFALVDGEDAIAICQSARLGAFVAEAGVETAAGYRGRGFATLVTAAWAQAIRARGLIPLYSTSWDNLASQGVARHLGARLYGADFHIP